MSHESMMAIKSLCQNFHGMTMGSMAMSMNARLRRSAAGILSSSKGMRRDEPKCLMR